MAAGCEGGGKGCGRGCAATCEVAGRADMHLLSLVRRVMATPKGESGAGGVELKGGSVMAVAGWVGEQSAWLRVSEAGIRAERLRHRPRTWLRLQPQGN